MLNEYRNKRLRDYTFSCAIFIFSLCIFTQTVLAKDRPNVLWLVCEDATTSWFGCYGNPEANTPNIDALATQGFRYTHVYATAPVCATQRSAWITGIHSISMGTAPMRSRYNIPHDLIRYYPDYLRDSGYYTANYNKTDYNIGGRADDACWDSNGNNAWNLRDPGQPFFQVLNFGQSHESKAQGYVTGTRHSPSNVTLRKYHPDTAKIRMNYAKYYDAIENLDTEIGKALDQLEKYGVADDTIVIFSSDHGGVLPRSKRFLFNSGIHSPMIVRIPEKYKELWPDTELGCEVDRLVSFLDLPKTFLSLTGSNIPEVMQGRIFLGPNAESEPEYVYSYRQRMDERIDNQRSVRNKRYAYIKNYMPYVAWGQHLDYLWRMEATQSWEAEYRANATNQITSRFFQTKPLEELYDMETDPDNVVNLANLPEHQHRLKTMRAELRKWQLDIYDSGLIPEFELTRRARNHDMTIYELVRDSRLYNLPGYLNAADLALQALPENEGRLVELLSQEDSGLRYWGVVGLLMLDEIDFEAQATLENLLDDSSDEVAAMAAWALIKFGHAGEANETLRSLLRQHVPATLTVLNILDWSNLPIEPYLEDLRFLEEKNKSLSGYERRMLKSLLKNADSELGVGPRSQDSSSTYTWTGAQGDLSFLSQANWTPLRDWKHGDILRFDGIQPGVIDLTFQEVQNTRVLHQFTASQTSDVSIRLVDDIQSRNFSLGNLDRDTAISIAVNAGQVTYDGQSDDKQMLLLFGAKNPVGTGGHHTFIHNEGKLEFGKYVTLRAGSGQRNYTLLFVGAGETTLRGTIGSFGSGGGLLVDNGHVLILEGHYASGAQQSLYINEGRVDFNSTAAVAGDEEQWAPIRIGNNIETGQGVLRYVGVQDSCVVRRIQIGNGVFGRNQTGAARIENESSSGKLIFANSRFNEPQRGSKATRMLTLGGSNLLSNEVCGEILDNNTKAGGVLGLIKTGSGRWILSGMNSYTGPTLVEEGALVVKARGAIEHSSPLLVSGGAVLDVTALHGGISVIKGHSIGGGVTIHGDLVFNHGAKFVFEPDVCLSVTGDLSLPDSFNISSLMNVDGTAIGWDRIEDGVYTLIEFDRANPAKLQLKVQGADKVIYFD
ncbi:sulfatase-like hydrolase/transferase [Coraliomargarita sp. W4R72]